MRTTAALLLATASLAASAQTIPVDRVGLPKGFEIQVFATGVKDARSMALGDQKLPGGGGTLFVGSMRAGAVYAIRHDGR